nr:hypothetical protein [Paenibacillus xylanexedens]
MVEIKRKKGELIPRTIDAGDVIIIGETPYFISCINDDRECLLIDLENGNSWNDKKFPEGINMFDLLNYTGETYANFELIKKGQYEMTINIK